MWPKGNFDQISKFHFLKFWQTSCESTGREVSFEWSHHRISSTDSKVRVTLQNSIKHSGSERVKNVLARVPYADGKITKWRETRLKRHWTIRTTQHKANHRWFPQHQGVNTPKFVLRLVGRNTPSWVCWAKRMMLQIRKNLSVIHWY